jgi:murein DD-endopeptidase MepM/ murein hydrolase activator NlpD
MADAARMRMDAAVASVVVGAAGLVVAPAALAAGVAVPLVAPAAEATVPSTAPAEHATVASAARAAGATVPSAAPAARQAARPAPAPAGQLTRDPSPAVAGGTPGPLRSGGAAYGAPIPRPDLRPIARRLTLTPDAVVAGAALPRIRFRVRQRGIERVRARVVVVRLPSQRPVARIVLGWVKPGRRVTVRWPGGVQLRAGRYVVRLHVRDGRGHTLRRSPRYPGRARIVVHAPKKPVPPPVASAPTPAVPLMPAPSPSPAGPGVFPVSGPFDFGAADARFGAGRPGHLHEGQDIIAASGTPVVAPYAGIVSRTSYQAAGAGEYVVLDAADGRDYFFAHCIRRSTAVVEGAAVSAGQQLCQVGNSGTASGPHLHFEIWNIGWRIPGGYPIDPLPELRTWAGV